MGKKIDLNTVLIHFIVISTIEYLILLYIKYSVLLMCLSKIKDMRIISYCVRVLQFLKCLPHCVGKRSNLFNMESYGI